MTIDQLSFVGGHLCLDFVNTAGDHLTDQPGEWLVNYHDFVRWAQRTGLTPSDDAAYLIDLANRQPDVAARALSRAITSREMIYRLLLGAVRQQPPDPSDLAAFNRELLEAPARRELIFDGDAYRWRLPAEVDSLDSLLWRLMWSAADLLASDRLAQVKVCAGEGCGWLFLDASRNQSRRWCSMADCGNRAKASRYYRRHQLE